MARLMYQGADLNNTRLLRVADPTSPTDGANKQYVDNALAGLAWKQPVKVATTTNGALATAYANGQSIDGVALVTGDRVLIKDQTTGAENGVYTVNASGAPTRATDADSTAELQSATVYVIQGTVNADKGFTQTANSPTVGTTALVWAQVGGGTAYSAGAGLSLAGSTFAVNPGAGIIADGTSTRVDPAYAKLVTKFSQNFGDGSATSFVITHNLGTKDRLGEPFVQVVATGEVTMPDILLGVNSDTVTTGAPAPASNSLRYCTSG